MLPKKLILLFSVLVGMMIIQLFILSLNSVKRPIEKPNFRPHHVNFTEKARMMNQGSPFLQVTTPEISTTILSTKFSTQSPTTLKILSPSTYSPTSADQEVKTSEEKVTSTVKQTTDSIQTQSTRKRFRPDDKMLFISEFDKAKDVKSVDVLLIILTYYKYFHRRENIRKTWLESCHRSNKIACWFFTDSLEAISDPKDKERILSEQKEYKDIIFTPIGNGIKFGLRFLHLLMWGKANYDFRYILRVDDDIMVCIDHLMWDLPNFPSTDVHYGWMHCQMPNVVYIDEGFSMYSTDLVERYLSQEGGKIMCHPFGDQQVAVWDHSLGIKGPDVYRPDNERIHHHPPASYDNGMKAASNICDNFIAIHGVYKDDALHFWKRRGSGHFNKYPAKKPMNFCPHYPNVDIRIFGGIYHHDPKLCSANPRWMLEHHSKYSGRER